MNRLFPGPFSSRLRATRTPVCSGQPFVIALLPVWTLAHLQARSTGIPALHDQAWRTCRCIVEEPVHRLATARA